MNGKEKGALSSPNLALSPNARHILKTLEKSDAQRGAPLAEIRQKFASRSTRALSVGDEEEGGGSQRRNTTEIPSTNTSNIPLPSPRGVSFKADNRTESGSVIRQSRNLIEKLIYHKPSELTAEDIANASNETIILYLPLVTGTIQAVGNEGATRELFLQILQAFLQRLYKSKSLKLFFSLLAGNPEYSSYWNLQLVHVSANLQNIRIKSGTNTNSITPELEPRPLNIFESFIFSEKNIDQLKLKTALTPSPTEVRTHNPVYGAQTPEGASTSSSNLKAPTEPKTDPKKEENKIKERKLKFRRSKKNNKVVDEAAADQQKINKRKTVIYDNKARGVGAIKVTLPVDIIEIQSIRFWTKTVQSVAPEVVKAKSEHGEKLDWNTSIIHPMAYLEKSKKSGKNIYDPKAADGKMEHELEMGEPVLSRVTVEKVFASIAAPMLLGNFYLPEDAKLEDEVELGPRIISKKGDNLFQDLAVETMSLCFNEIWKKEYLLEKAKTGKSSTHNNLKDSTNNNNHNHPTKEKGEASSLHASAEKIKEEGDANKGEEKKKRKHFRKHHKNTTDQSEKGEEEEEDDEEAVDDFPFSYTYQVIPTGHQEGIIEVCYPAIAFKSFDWDDWFNKRTPASVRRLINSAAGGFIGCFVLGVRDRHWDNILVLGGDTVLNIDFGYLLGRRPPIDAPEFAVSKKMRDNLRMAKMWVPFLNKCVLAFRWLRRNSDAVIRTCRIVFAQMGISPDHVEVFLRSKQSLALDSTDAEAEENIRNLIEASANSWQNLFKQVSHGTIDPVYYGLLKMHFPVAVFAQNLVRKSDAKKAEERRYQGQGNKGKDDITVMPKSLDRKMSRKESKDDLNLLRKSRGL